jgi:hypothetical protein
MEGKMSKRMSSGLVLFSMFLMLVLVVYLNAAPQTCAEGDQEYCEGYLEGDFTLYFDWWSYYYGEWWDTYWIGCTYDWPPVYHDWGYCYDFDDVYEDPPGKPGR